ncbi:hypothetical protein SRHO_G00255140 [Serrasalmus rhombeus]
MATSRSNWPIAALFLGFYRLQTNPGARRLSLRVISPGSVPSCAQAGRVSVWLSCCLRSWNSRGLEERFIH